MIAQALQLLNESHSHVYSLAYNPVTSKYVVLSMDRKDSNAGTFVVRPLTAGETPEAALKDAMLLATAKYAAETVPSNTY